MSVMHLRMHTVAHHHLFGSKIQESIRGTEITYVGTYRLLVRHNSPSINGFVSNIYRFEHFAEAAAAAGA